METEIPSKIPGHKGFERPSGTRYPWAAYPGVRCASPGLSSIRPSGTVKTTASFDVYAFHRVRDEGRSLRKKKKGKRHAPRLPRLRSFESVDGEREGGRRGYGRGHRVCAGQGDGVGSLGRVGNGGTATRTAAARGHGEAGGGQDNDPSCGTELARVAAQESSQQQSRERYFGGKPVGGLAGPGTATDAVAAEGTERMEAGLRRASRRGAIGGIGVEGK